MKLKMFTLLAVAAVLAGCDKHETDLTGKACLGANNDTVVESHRDKCSAGDVVATKHPAYFCDFTYAVTYNAMNSAFCVYRGEREERIQ
ncbi:hypothetical protein SAMN05216178_6729 [Pseudomonas saponiphila]|jgi:hypothetical protein|uniref:Lipoprotein n=1 Tax=Pseudomonas saponiphila TaxID=556534 RepID=A0A1H4ZNW5_9PSED|nr:hypothetical protein [Pseudomonas saponiphila]SED31070.1 hypothetical protein SAMN05216178_6729 [Pseudomonas saponiphila]